MSRQEVRAETGEGITHTRVALHCSTRPCTRPVAGGRGAAAVLMLKEHGGPRPRLHSHGCLVISRPTCPEARHTLQGCVFVQILPRTNGSRTQGPAAHLPRTVRERTTVRERAVSAFAVPKSSPMCYGWSMSRAAGGPRAAELCPSARAMTRGSNTADSPVWVRG